MKLLLDTHAFIWWTEGHSRLPVRVAEAIRDPANTVRLSLASVWEMQIKVQLGKLQLSWPLPRLIQLEEAANNVRLLAITREDIFALHSLPPIHRDPFDRIIAAQTMRGDFKLVSHDPVMTDYGLSVLW